MCRTALFAVSKICIKQDGGSIRIHILTRQTYLKVFKMKELELHITTWVNTNLNVEYMGV